MTDKAMSGAELKVMLTGLGLTPGWLADQLHVTSRTILRWMDQDAIPAKAATMIETISEVTDSEIEKMALAAQMSGVIRTRRTEEGVAERNTPLPATWHRHLTFRALKILQDSDTPVKVEYATAQ
jgi:hypothetical protein